MGCCLVIQRRWQEARLCPWTLLGRDTPSLLKVKDRRQGSIHRINWERCQLVTACGDGKQRSSHRLWCHIGGGKGEIFLVITWRMTEIFFSVLPGSSFLNPLSRNTKRFLKFIIFVCSHCNFQFADLCSFQARVLRKNKKQTQNKNKIKIRELTTGSYFESQCPHPVFLYSPSFKPFCQLIYIFVLLLL